MSLPIRIRQIFSANGAGIGDRIFISLFYSLFITYLSFHSAGFALEHFTGRPISNATAHDIDIGERVLAFYQGFGLFLLLAAGLLWSFRFLNSTFTSADWRILNATSLAGFCLLFFELLGSSTGPSLHLVVALHIPCVAGAISRWLIKSPGTESDEVSIFAWIVILSSCFFIPVSIFKLAGSEFHSFPIFIAVGSTVLLLTYRYMASQSWSDHQSWSLNSVHALKPLVFLPLLPIVSNELFLIANQRGFSFLPSGISFTLFSLIVLVYVIIRYRSRRKKPNTKPPETIRKTLFNFYFPWFIFGILCLTFYQPVVSPELDWFEDANKVIPLQQFFEFGKIPFIHTFSSHALYDFIWGFIYSFLNGYDPYGGWIYGFLMRAIFILIIYFFIYRVTSNGFFALWITLFFPYTELILPSYYNIIPLSALVLIAVIDKQSVRRYVLFFTTLFFMVCWRIDLGVANVVALLLGFILIGLFLPTFRVDWKNLRKGFLFASIPWLIIFLITLFTYGNLIFHSLSSVRGYIASAQSYGNTGLSASQDMTYYSLYFVLPVAVFLVLGYLLYRLSRARQNEQLNLPLVISLVFLSIYFFANFQRGLIRHTLVEQWDTAFTSFGFFILASCVFLSHTGEYIRPRIFLAFFILSSILVINYKFSTPDLKTENIYAELTKKIQHPLLQEYSDKKITRISAQDGWNRDKYGELGNFLDQHFPKPATFLDFSNTPMLYPYLHRATPDYFCQIPHTAHNDELQDELLKSMKNYELPAVVFSNYPETFWDNLDGIPNTLRHYKISGLIFRDYQPFSIMSHHSIWLKKGSEIPREIKHAVLHLNSLSSCGSHNITFQDSVSFTTGGDHPALSLPISPRNPVTFNEEKQYYIVAEAWSDNGGMGAIRFTSDQKESDQTNQVTFRRGHTQIFAIIEKGKAKSITGIDLQLPSNMHLTIPSVQLIEANYIPDYYSTSPKTYDLKYIPFIWGQYDDAYKSNRLEEKNILLNQPLQPEKNSESRFRILNKGEPGCVYVLVSVRSGAEQPFSMLLNYGTGNDFAGSFAFTIKNDKIIHNYLIRANSQYNWFRRMPDWISFYSGNNDVEITSIRLLDGE